MTTNYDDRACTLCGNDSRALQNFWSPHWSPKGIATGSFRPSERLCGACLCRPYSEIKALLEAPADAAWCERMGLASACGGAA